MPSLRRTLTQLLGGLEFSGDDLTREVCAVLCCAVRAMFVVCMFV